MNYPEVEALRSSSVLIVEDHVVMAEALAVALQLHGFEDVEVFCGHAIDELSVIGAAKRAERPLVLLDLWLGDGRLSVPLIVPLREAGAQVLLLTAERDPRVLAHALDAGADGLFDKGQPFDQLISVLIDAAHGRSVLSAAVREALMTVVPDDRRAITASSPFDRLSPREQEILRALIDGQTVEDIAAHVGIAASTVRTHVRAVLRKLGVTSQLAAVALARAHGWPTPVGSRFMRR